MKRLVWTLSALLLGAAGEAVAIEAGESGENKALACAEGTTATLSATPAKVALGGKITLAWSVTQPTGCNGTLTLANQTVAKSGTLAVDAVASRRFALALQILGARRTLAEASVEVTLPAVVEIKHGTGDWKSLFVQAVGTPNTVVKLVEGLELDLTGYENVDIAQNVVVTSERNPRPVSTSTSTANRLQSVAGNAQVATASTSSSPTSPLPVPIPAARDPRNVGPRIFTKTRPKPLLRIQCGEGDPSGDGVRLFGFRLHGPHFERKEDDANTERGIEVDSCVDVEISNLEVAGWSGTAIAVNDRAAGSFDRTKAQNSCSQPNQPADGRLNKTNPKAVWIHDNFIHHNDHDGTNGYGVNVSHGAYALIERNVFDHNRHALASDGRPKTGYTAVHNLMLKGGGIGKCPDVGGVGIGVLPGVDDCFATHLFDVHGQLNCSPVLHRDSAYNCGPAGEKLVFTHNAFQWKIDKGYTGGGSAPAIKVRGHPCDSAFVGNNVFPHGDVKGDAVEQNTEQAPSGAKSITYGSGATANTKNVQTYGEYGVCDFDGDGRDDFFLGTGVNWWFSSYGKMHWVWLNAATERLKQVGLGDFDGDKRCDVLAVNTSDKSWEISRGGVMPWAKVGSFGIPLAELAFADFDGDGATDVFRRAPDGQWSIYSVKKKEWRTVASSSFPLKELRFGDFTGDKKADVLSLAGGNWSISEGATSAWTKLGKRHSKDIEKFIIADVRGDGRPDVIVPSGLGFKISDDGKGDLKKLDIGKMSSKFVKLGGVAPRFFWGRFDHKPGADFLGLDNRRMGWIASNGKGDLQQYGAYQR